MVINEFNKEDIANIVAMDTETRTYIDGVLMSTEEIKKLFATKDNKGNLIYNTAWARKHVTVDVYAWLISDGRKFAYLETFDEFVEFCCQHKVLTIWWYNSKFDFAFIDYKLLTNGWTLNNDGKKYHDKQYNSLHGEQGQRYKLTLAKDYNRKTTGNRHKTTHVFSNYDFMNLFSGGLAKNLEAFKVVDYDGNPIRKLEMDYQGEIDENAIQYMKNDAHGLFHLVRIASEFLEQEFNYSLMVKNPVIITAGGLAKRVLLKYMYGFDDDKKNVKKFKQSHKMTLELDQEMRAGKLYQGGKTIANPKYLNKLLKTKIYYYDRNSMYPAEMEKMPDLVGGLLTLNKKYLDFYKSHNYQIIYEIENYNFIKKDGALCVLYDPFIKQYVTSMSSSFYNNRPFLIFDFELEMLSNFYEIKCDFKSFRAIQKSNNKGIKNFVNYWYDKKSRAKIEKNAVLSMFSKLLLNSAYGKLSQNPSRQKSHREINPETGAVTLVEDEETTDENALLSVIMGAYITAKARCNLMGFIIDLCGGAEHTENHVFYMDTDSVQTDIEYKKADPITLGGWKLEENKPFDGGKWLAPKTYLLYSENENGQKDFVIHSKGVATKVLNDIFKNELNQNEIDDIFKVGRTFQTLCGLNVKGGKALLPLEKMLCRPDNIKCVDGSMILDERE